MLYRVNMEGYRLVKADSPEEAEDKANNEDYTEESWWVTTTEEYEE